MIVVLAVGKKHESWVAAGIERYQQRLRQPFGIEWNLLPHSSKDGDQARSEESERLLRQVRPDDFVVLLDERGKRLTSPSFSELLETKLTESVRLVVVIGGAYGVDRTMHERADFTLSLSDLVLPHQLVRLILTEQLYRAQEIAKGGKYHHE